MKKYSMTLALYLALIGCTGEQVPGETSDSPDSNFAREAGTTPSPATTPGIAERVPAELVPASELVGEWRIAGVDGEEIDQPYAITASITDRQIHVVADCINIAWSYTAESGSFDAKRVPVEGCGRGMTPKEEAIVTAIDTATGFGKVPSNAMEIFSQQHRVTLYRQ